MPPFDLLSFTAGVVACLFMSALVAFLFAIVNKPVEQEDELEFCYWRRGVPPLEGWEVVADFEGTHHYEYEILMRKGHNNERNTAAEREGKTEVLR